MTDLSGWLGTDKVYLPTIGEHGSSFDENMDSTFTNIYNRIWGDGVYNAVSDYSLSTSGTAAANASNLNTAIGAAVAASKALVIPGGTYEVATNVIKFRNGLHLICQGPVILKNTSTSGFVIRTQDNSGNCPPESSIVNNEFDLSMKVDGPFCIDMNSKGDVGLLLECVWRGHFNYISVINVPDGTFSYDDGGGSQTYNKTGIYLKGITSATTGAYYNLFNHTFVSGISSESYGKDGIALGTTTGQTTYNANMNSFLHPRVLWLTTGFNIITGNSNLIDHPELSTNTTGMSIADDRMDVRSPYIESCTTGLSFGSSADRCIVRAPIHCSSNTTNFSNAGTQNHVEWEAETVFTNKDATPDITIGNMFAINYTEATDITNFDGGRIDKMITLRRSGGDGTPTIKHDTDKVRLDESSDWAMATGDVLTLKYNGSIWYEVCRMDYSGP